MDLPKTISDIHNGLIKGNFSCIELTNSYLAKIKKENNNLNDFLNLTEDLALE
jgi:aspartyl-tRNA(Asn)/glutamyl-tRNA(Gln) amidotransferase subunit A